MNESTTQAEIDVQLSEAKRMLRYEMSRIEDPMSMQNRMLNEIRVAREQWAKQFLADPEHCFVHHDFRYFQTLTALLAVMDASNTDYGSGGSAPYIIAGITNDLRKLLMGEPLTPLFGTDDEWIDITPTCLDATDEDADSPPQFLKFQNRRCTSVFKDVNLLTGLTVYTQVDACRFTQPSIDYYWGGAGLLPDDDSAEPTPRRYPYSSSVTIKQFPYTPVNDVCVLSEDRKHVIKHADFYIKEENVTI